MNDLGLCGDIRSQTHLGFRLDSVSRQTWETIAHSFGYVLHELDGPATDLGTVPASVCGNNPQIMRTSKVKELSSDHVI